MTVINVVIDKAQKLNGEYSLFITFDYDAQVVDVIRDLSSKWWHADVKTWEVPLMKLPVLLQKLPSHQFNISGQYVTTKKETHKIPDGFSFKTTPFEHQKEAFQFGLDNDKWLLGDEQGLGKTKQSIDIAVAKKLEKGYQHCLIICGVNGLKWNWQKEIEIHSNEHGYILGQKLNSKKQLVIGSNTDKYNDVLNLHNNSNYFIITNVESLRNEDICKALADKCKSGEIGMIITDEIHKCFDYNTPILTNQGILKIGDIVTKKLSVDVASYNEVTGDIEYKSVTNHFENPVSTRFLRLKIQTNCGIKEIKCTDNHKFYTRNRGWICVKDLKEDDDILEY